jgi:hypothetical protein
MVIWEQLAFLDLEVELVVLERLVTLDTQERLGQPESPEQLEGLEPLVLVVLAETPLLRLLWRARPVCCRRPS